MKLRVKDPYTRYIEIDVDLEEFDKQAWAGICDEIENASIVCMPGYHAMPQAPVKEPEPKTMKCANCKRDADVGVACWWCGEIVKPKAE